MRPAFAVGRVRHFRQPHPCGQDAPSVRAFRRLGRVEVEAGIQFVEAIVFQLQIVQLEVIADDIAGPEDVPVMVALWFEALRREEQYRLSVDFEQVGAFPHIAEVRQLDVQLPLQLPGQSIR